MKNIIPEQFFQYCESYSKLHLEQKEGRKKRSVIDILATFVHNIQKEQKEEKLAIAFVIKVKRVFDYISKRQLLKYMIELGMDSNFVT